MRLLVTGGAGFIGSHFVCHVLRTTSDVRVTNVNALFFAGNPASLRDIDDDAGCCFVRGDIRDIEVVDREVGDDDAVVNFAAESHAHLSMDGPREAIDTIVVGWEVVFDACRRHWVEEVLHISTDEVYGSIDESYSFTEADPLVSDSPYSTSKAAAEDHLARSHGSPYGFPIMVTWTPNNDGPYHCQETVIQLFVTGPIAERKVPLYGGGSKVWDWTTHLQDNVAAQWLVLTEGTPREVYDFGVGNELSNKKLTYAILQQFNAGEDRIEFVADRPGHDKRHSIEASKSRPLGRRPQITFGDGLQQTIAWYRANEDWWRSLQDANATTHRGVAT